MRPLLAATAARPQSFAPWPPPLAGPRHSKAAVTAPGRSRPRPPRSPAPDAARAAACAASTAARPGSATAARPGSVALPRLPPPPLLAAPLRHRARRKSRPGRRAGATPGRSGTAAG